MSTNVFAFRSLALGSAMFAVASLLVSLPPRVEAQVQIGGIGIGGGGVNVGGIGGGVSPGGVGVSAGPIGASIGAPGGVSGVGVGLGPGAPGIGLGFGSSPTGLPSGAIGPRAPLNVGPTQPSGDGRALQPVLSTLRSTRSIEPVAGTPGIPTTVVERSAPATLGTMLGDGLRIRSVTSGVSPISQRLQVGDRVVGIDGVAVRTMNDLQTVLSDRVLGEDALVTFERNGEVRSRLVRLVAADATTDAAAIERRTGADGAQELSVARFDEQGRIVVPMPEQAQRLENALGLNLGEGLQVAGVTPHGLASELGLATNDVIVAVNGQAVSSADQVLSLIHAPLVGGESALTVLRDAELLSIPLAPTVAQLAPTGVDRQLPVIGQTYAPVGVGVSALDQQAARTGVGTGALLSEAPLVGQTLTAAGSGTGVQSTSDHPADVGTGTGAGTALDRVPLVGDTLTGSGAGAVLQSAPLVNDAIAGTGGATAAGVGRSGTSAATGAGAGALLRRAPVVGPTLSGTGTGANVSNEPNGTASASSGTGTGALLQRAPLVGQTLSGTGVAAAAENSATGGTSLAAGGGQGALVQRVPVVGETLAGVGAGAGLSNSANGTAVGVGGGGGAMLGRVPLAGTTAAGVGVGTGATLNGQGLTIDPGLGGGVVLGADQGGSIGGGNQSRDASGYAAGGRGAASGGNGGITFGAPGSNSRAVGSGTSAGGDARPSDAQGGIALQPADNAAQPGSSPAKGSTSAGGQAASRQARGGLALRQSPSSTFIESSNDRTTAGASSTSGDGQGGLATSLAAPPSPNENQTSAGGSAATTEAQGGATTQRSAMPTVEATTSTTEAAGGQSSDSTGSGGAARTSNARAARSYSLVAGGDGNPNVSSGGVGRSTSSTATATAGSDSTSGGGGLTSSGGRGGLAMTRSLPDSGPLPNTGGNGAGGPTPGDPSPNGGPTGTGGSNAGGFGTNGVSVPPGGPGGTDDDAPNGRRNRNRAAGGSNPGALNISNVAAALQPGDDLGAGFVYAGSGPGVVGAMFGDDLSVAYISPGSAGAQAGMQVGDRLLGIDGLTFATFGEFAVAMKSSTHPGETVQLVVERNGGPVSLAATLAPLPATATYGLDMDGPMPRELVDQKVAVRDALLPLGVQITESLAVGYVDPTSRTFAEGIRRGDSINAVNGVPAGKLDDLAAISRARAGDLTADFAFDGGTRRIGGTMPAATSEWIEVIRKADQVAVDDGLQVVAAGYERVGGNNGLRSGDKILVVNAQRVSSPQELSLAVANAKQMHVVVQRGDRRVSVVWDRSEST